LSFVVVTPQNGHSLGSQVLDKSFDESCTDTFFRRHRVQGDKFGQDDIFTSSDMISREAFQFSGDQSWQISRFEFLPVSNNPAPSPPSFVQDCVYRTLISGLLLSNYHFGFTSRRDRTMNKARTINDYYVTVFLHRYRTDNPSKTGERIDIIVRIPEEAAKILLGSRRRPEMISHEICRRASRVARQTVGMPQAPWAMEAISVVELAMPSDLPEASRFQDTDGSEGWIYSVKSGVPRPPPAMIVEPGTG
jgi:hypothetical protein